MKKIILLFVSLVIVSCTKDEIYIEEYKVENIEINNSQVNDSVVNNSQVNDSVVNNSQVNDSVVNNSSIYPLNNLQNYSDLNKKTSWYRTNMSFNKLYNTHRSRFWGFEVNGTTLIPFVQGTWSSTKNYYWAELGGYLYTDLNGDGLKDLWSYYYKNPWPTNSRGLHLFNEIEKNSTTSDIQIGLTQVRKQVLSDFNNDGIPEVMLFSHGYDSPPHPGDSLAYFSGITKKYKYLTDDIGYFHGGATGDINNDGYEDIVAYSGGSQLIPVHPTCYINDKNGDFVLSNQIFKNFTLNDNYYTVELFDIDGDGWLDLFLGGKGSLIYIKNINGTFDRNNSVDINDVQSNSKMTPVDISFFDFDKDGREEILVMNEKNTYNGFDLRVYKLNGSDSDDVTMEYFENTTQTGNGAWIKWMRIFDYDGDGDLDLVADGLFGSLNGTAGRVMYWKNENGKFKL